MSRRKYDHLRFRENEDRRLLDLLKRFPGEPPSDAYPFGINSPEVTAHFDERDARLERRTCSNGRCTVFWDTKRQETAWSIGPVGCCDE